MWKSLQQHNIHMVSHVIFFQQKSVTLLFRCREVSRRSSEDTTFLLGYCQGLPGGTRSESLPRGMFLLRFRVTCSCHFCWERLSWMFSWITGDCSLRNQCDLPISLPPAFQDPKFPVKSLAWSRWFTVMGWHGRKLPTTQPTPDWRPSLTQVKFSTSFWNSTWDVCIVCFCKVCLIWRFGSFWYICISIYSWVLIL